jgi:tetratricopeptide (TPR) repeat protein
MLQPQQQEPHMTRLILHLCAAVTLSAGTGAQPAWKAQNLQHFPKDIPRQELIQRMREFSFALGVRCEYCHDAPEGNPNVTPNFASDDKMPKQKARAMLRMVDQLNSNILPTLPSRVEPRVEVSCATCHRGLPLPKTLQTTLFEIVKKDGAAAAVTRYRELRRDHTLSGRYNFGEWEINELGRRLIQDGAAEAALTILEMNAEFYPKSGSLQFQIGELLLAKGMKDQALERYKAALALLPDHPGAKGRIAELEKK